MSYLRDGYDVVDLGARGRGAARNCRAELCDMLGCALEEYDREDLDLHARAAELATIWTREVIEAELPYFQALMGRDIHIQQKPFLRISRPGVATDNIGFHRDTWYGDTPYEISVWIPFTDTDDGNALRVAPGSHTASEASYPTERYERPDVEKGSAKHALGFIYNPPKRTALPVPTIPLPVKVGQMIVFSLSLLHGQEVNRSTRTRVSMDVRLANSLANIKFSRSRNESYYEQLCVSPVTEAARLYEAANK